MSKWRAVLIAMLLLLPVVLVAAQKCPAGCPKDIVDRCNAPDKANDVCTMLAVQGQDYCACHRPLPAGSKCPLGCPDEVVDYCMAHSSFDCKWETFPVCSCSNPMGWYVFVIIAAVCLLVLCCCPFIVYKVFQGKERNLCLLVSFFWCGICPGIAYYQATDPMKARGGQYYHRQVQMQGNPYARGAYGTRV